MDHTRRGKNKVMVLSSEEEEEEEEDSDCDEAYESDDGDVDDSSLSDKVVALLRGFNFTNEINNAVLMISAVEFLCFSFEFARRKRY